MSRRVATICRSSSLVFMSSMILPAAYWPTTRVFLSNSITDIRLLHAGCATRWCIVARSILSCLTMRLYRDCFYRECASLVSSMNTGSAVAGRYNCDAVSTEGQAGSAYFLAMTRAEHSTPMCRPLAEFTSPEEFTCIPRHSWYWWFIG